MRTVQFKHVSVTGAAAVLALTLVACGSGDGGSSQSDSGKKELTIVSGWVSGTPEGILQAKIAEDFEQKTGIHLSIDEGGQEVRDIYETAYTAGDAPDLALANLYDKTLGWTEAGVTVSVSEYAEEWDLLDRIKPDALEAWTNSEGQLRAFPFQGFTWPVLWNTDLLDAAGAGDAPTTEDEFTALIDAVPGATVFAAAGADWGGEKLFSQIIQDRITADEARELFSQGGWKDSAAARAGVDYFVQIRDSGVFNPAVQGQTVDMMYADYNEADAFAMSAGSWAFGDVPEEVRAATYVGGFPISDQSVHSKPTAYQGFTSTGFWISPKGVEKIDMVRQFVEYMYSDEVVSMFAREGNIIPAVTTSGPVESENDIMAQALNELDGRVDFVVLQDIYVPASAAAAFTSATALAWGDADTDAILSALDQAYGQ